MDTTAPYLRQLRLDAGLTQPEAAARIGIHPKTVERWEAGKHEPPASELAAYVRALGGDVGQALRLLIGADQDVLTDEEEVWFRSLSPAQKRRVRALLRGPRSRIAIDGAANGAYQVTPNPLAVPGDKPGQQQARGERSDDGEPVLGCDRLAG